MDNLDKRKEADRIISEIREVGYRRKEARWLFVQKIIVLSLLGLFVLTCILYLVVGK